MKKIQSAVHGACAVLFFVVVLAAAPALAQDGGEKSWYLEAHGGMVFEQSAELHLPQATGVTGPVDVSGEVTFHTGWGGGLAAGRIWKDFRIEGEGVWRRIGVDHINIDHHPDNPVLVRIEDSIQRSLKLTGNLSVLKAMANVYWDVPTGMRFRPYVGGGMGTVHAVMHKNARRELSDAQLAMLPEAARMRLDGSNVLAQDSKDEDRWGFCWQVGGGIGFDLTESLAVSVGYRFVHIPSLEFHLFRGQRLSTQLPGTVTVKSLHSVDLGVRWRF